MSPASKSKSKDKLAARADKLAAKAVKEQPKGFLKPSSAPANNGNGIPGSAYNPLSCTFHTIETAPSASLPPPQNNGRFRNINETEEDSGSSQGTIGEYDSLSNNDSCSGESEDLKEKMTSSVPRAEFIPGSDTDKRDKIRQKNEKKHQRQKEKRAQELHERCNGYLMSRKLEALSLKLVSMGFSPERATMALILNEGHVEESVAWLFEVGEESKEDDSTTDLVGPGLKIDIADELAQIAALEIKFKCTKQEVEKAVVACDGDLMKAEETLNEQKQEPLAAPPKSERPGESVTSTDDLGNKVASSFQIPTGRTQVKGVAVAPINIQQRRRDGRDFNYTKTVITGNLLIESTNRSLQSSIKIHTQPDWVRPQLASTSDKRWPSANSSLSVPYSSVSPMQVAVPQAKSEVRYVKCGSHEVMANMQAGNLKEPITVMQRPQSNSGKQNLPPASITLSVSPPPASMGLFSNGVSSVGMMKLAPDDGGLGDQMRNLKNLGASGSQQFYPQNHHQPLVSSPLLESIAPGWGSTWSTTGTSAGSSSSLAMPSSLGLFTGWQSSGSSSPVDWSAGGSMPQCDYTNIDWSLDRASLGRPSSKGSQLYDTWSATYMSANASSRSAANGFQDGSLVTDPSISAGSHEWTSPFAGKDLFRVPRQFVTSPSL